jgi:PST family polysaccharide transporter
MSRLAKAVALFGASSVVGTLSQILKGKLAAFVLGPVGVGVLGQLTNLWTLFNALSGLSLYNGIVQRIAAGVRDEDRELVARHFSSSLLFLTAFSCSTSVLGAIFSPFISDLVFGDRGQRSLLVAVILLSVPLGVTAQTYRSLMTGHTLVKPVVVAQVASDILGALVFIPLILWKGLLGAVLAFCGLQLFKIFFQLRVVAAELGRRYLRPSLRGFSWGEVRVNLGFGANGMLMAIMSIGTSLALVRMIISSEGLEATGLYSAAWKVATLYFGAIYAAAGGFFLPLLVATKSDAELEGRVNETALLYLFLLPPAIVALLAAAPELMTLLFTREFKPSAALLSMMLPADLMRITAETMGLAFLAKRKLFKYSVIYLGWVIAFLCVSYFSLEVWGLQGIAVAYLVAHTLNLAVVIVLCRSTFSMRLQSGTSQALLLGLAACCIPALMMWGGASFAARLAVSFVTLAAWLALSWRQPMFQELSHRLIRRLRK